jgi:hypothetical protein
MNTHEDYGRDVGQERSSDRSFGLLFFVFLLAVGLWPLRHGHAVRWGAVGLSTAFLLAALMRPKLLGGLNRLWAGLARLLNRVTQPVAMFVLYYLVFTPFAWLLRFFRKDSLGIAWDPSAATYWRNRAPGDSAPNTMANQF